MAVSVIFSGNEVRVYRQSARGKWSSATVEDTGNTTRATLIELPSGRLVCIYSYQVSSTRTQIRSSYSDDDGATWTEGSTAGLDTPLTMASSDVLRLRAAYLNGLTALFIWAQTGGADVIYQYVSSDGGNQWTLVETSFSADAAYPDVCVSGGAIYVGLLQYSASWTPPIRPYVYRLSSAGQALSSATGADASGTGATFEQPATYAGGVFTAGDFALCATDDGYLWTYSTEFGYLAYTGTRETLVRVSTDSGQTWYDNHLSSHTYTAAQNIAYSGSAATALRDLCAVAERGRVILFHSPQTNPGGVATNF
ncbi:MAG: exo-alpha-sialidase, partial [Actinobacteria bacterium]|nr:exo-alpha-sialidase [Actinomycetota bacterium]